MPALLIPIVLVVFALVMGNFESSIDHSDLSTDASASINDTVDNTWNSYDLAGVLPIVVIAMIVIGILLGAFAIKGF